MRAQAIGLIGLIASLLAGIPEAQAQGTRGHQAHGRPHRGAGALVPMRAVALLPPSFQWKSTDGRILGRAQKPEWFKVPPSIAFETSEQTEMKRNVVFVLSELTGDRALRSVVASLSSSSTLSTRPTVSESMEQERARQRATFVEIEERRGITPIITSPAAQIAYASSGACLFAGGIVASKVLPVSLGHAVTAVPQPWPAGIRISGSFNLP